MVKRDNGVLLNDALRVMSLSTSVCLEEAMSGSCFVDRCPT